MGEGGEIKAREEGGEIKKGKGDSAFIMCQFMLALSLFILFICHCVPVHAYVITPSSFPLFPCRVFFFQGSRYQIIPSAECLLLSFSFHFHLRTLAFSKMKSTPILSSSPLFSVFMFFNRNEHLCVMASFHV